MLKTKITRKVYKQFYKLLHLVISSYKYFHVFKIFIFIFFAFKLFTIFEIYFRNQSCLPDIM